MFINPHNVVTLLAQKVEAFPTIHETGDNDEHVAHRLFHVLKGAYEDGLDILEVDHEATTLDYDLLDPEPSDAESYSDEDDTLMDVVESSSSQSIESSPFKAEQSEDSYEPSSQSSPLKIVATKYSHEKYEEIIQHWRGVKPKRPFSSMKSRYKLLSTERELYHMEEAVEKRQQFKITRMK